MYSEYKQFCFEKQGNKSNWFRMLNKLIILQK